MGPRDLAGTAAEERWPRASVLYDAGKAQQALLLLDVVAKSDPKGFDTRWLRGLGPML